MTFVVWLWTASKLFCVPTKRSRNRDEDEAPLKDARAASPTSRPPRIAMRFGDECERPDTWAGLVTGERHGRSASQTDAPSEPPAARVVGQAGAAYCGQARSLRLYRVPPRPDVAPGTGLRQLTLSAASTPCLGPGRPLVRASGNGSLNRPSTMPEDSDSARQPPPFRRNPFVKERPGPPLLPPPRRPVRSAAWTPSRQHHAEKADETSSHAGLRAAADRTEPPLRAMDRACVLAALDVIGRLMMHFPIAICGDAALISHGCDGPEPDHVAVACPNETYELIREWARKAGLKASAHFSQAFYVVVGSARRDVCVRLLGDANFFRLDRLKRGRWDTPVLTLPLVANDKANAFYMARDSPRDCARHGADLLWLLRAIAESGESRDLLTQERAPKFGTASFLILFVRLCPEAVPLFRGAGLLPERIPPEALALPEVPLPEVPLPAAADAAPPSRYDGAF